ncbi:MAG: hypothetical protein EU547_03170 [Promethearchaeota archaeon]|nr:MAG: hypothetical protein EU547_03170 [Candidatus Lokiarchaeota archaeon]
MVKMNLYKKQILFGLLIGIIGFSLCFNTLITSSGPIKDNNIENNNLDLTELTLYEAMSSPLVNVTINGTLSFFWGQCIEVYCEQLTTEDLKITISAGTVLTPADTEVQDMIVAKTEEIYLMFEGHNDTKLLYAFCGEFEDAAPGPLDNFTVSPSSYGPSTCVGKILTFFETNDTHLDDQVGQYAIWACLEGVTAIKIATQALGIDEAVNAVLVESGSGLSFYTTTPMIPGFNLLTIFVTLLSTIGFAVIILRKKYFQ